MPHETLSIIPLFEGDQRCEALYDSLVKELYSRGKDIPVPSILGLLEMLKIQVVEDARG